jgi:hypothetical protein
MSSTPQAQAASALARREDFSLPTYSAKKSHITMSALVNLARRYSTAAITTLNTIMLDEKQPAAVRVRAAELLLERGYGKAPQAVMVGNADGQPLVGPQALSIAERIAHLKVAEDQKVEDARTVELEASAVTEVSEDLVG